MTGLSLLIPPYPFKTDGCTCFPSGGYDECCVRHDLVYWYGGSNEEREAADIQLMKCAADKGYPKTGIILRFGASVGGCVLAVHTFSLGVRIEISAVGAGEIKYEV
jgi:hypothetical protein